MIMYYIQKYWDEIRKCSREPGWCPKYTEITFPRGPKCKFPSGAFGAAKNSSIPGHFLVFYCQNQCNGMLMAVITCIFFPRLITICLELGGGQNLD